MEDSHNSYLSEILKKFNFIQSVMITDFEGALISGAQRSDENSSTNTNVEATSSMEEDRQGELDKNNKIKVSLCYQFNSALDQITKIEKWNLKYLVSVYDTVTIFQSRVNKLVIAHFICDSKNFNYELLKDVVQEVSEKLQKVDKELENMIQMGESN